MAKDSIRVGVFDAEASWRSAQHARLPSLGFTSASLPELALDELLFPWLDDCSRLLTLLPLEESHLAYLKGLRSEVEHFAVFKSLEEWKSSGCPSNTFEAATAKGLITKGWEELSPDPYAITRELVNSFSGGHGCCWPHVNDVVAANSKMFSFRCSSLFEPKVCAAAMSDVGQLRHIAELWIGHPLLVKDPFGVSGSGQYLIRDQAAMDRLIVHLEEQQRSGLSIEFLVETLTPFRTEFGAYYDLAVDGSYSHRGTRQTLMRGTRYMGSVPATPILLAWLDSNQYHEILSSYLQELHSVGYFGPVCFDSAITEAGSLRAVVEINARKSIGSMALDCSLWLQQYSTDADVLSTDLTIKTPVSFQTMLADLDRCNLLWRPSMKAGVLPLTSGSLCYVAEKAGPRRGRWYYAIVGQDAGERAGVLKAFARWSSSQASLRFLQ